MTEYVTISLWQPWASLIFATHPGGHPVKIHETRNRRAPPKYLGTRIAIHAALQPIVARNLAPELQELCDVHFGDDWAHRLPRGELIGTAILESSTVIGPWPHGAKPANRDDEICGWWERGRHAWRLAMPVPLARTLPYSGQRGWWRAVIRDGL